MNKVMVDRMVMCTENISPPIPFRSFDWIVWIDGDEEKNATGETEEQAIQNYIEMFVGDNYKDFKCPDCLRLFYSNKDKVTSCPWRDCGFSIP